MFSSPRVHWKLSPSIAWEAETTCPWSSPVPHYCCLSSPFALAQLKCSCVFSVTEGYGQQPLLQGHRGQSETSHRLATVRGDSFPSPQCLLPYVCVLCPELSSPVQGYHWQTAASSVQVGLGWSGGSETLGWLGWTGDGFGRRTLMSHPIPIGRFSRKWFQALHGAAWFDDKRGKSKGERFKVQGLAWIWIGTSSQWRHLSRLPGQCILLPPWERLI